MSDFNAVFEFVVNVETVDPVGVLIGPPCGGEVRGRGSSAAAAVHECLSVFELRSIGPVVKHFREFSVPGDVRVELDWRVSWASGAGGKSISGQGVVTEFPVEAAVLRVVRLFLQKRERLLKVGASGAVQESSIIRRALGTG